MNRKTYMYKGFLVKIIDFSFDDEMCRLETTRQIIQRPQKEVLAELDEFLESEEEMSEEEEEKGMTSPKEMAVLVPQLKSFEIADTMMQGLLRAFDEVEHNPGFKEQARTMTEIAGKVVDYAKVQVDAYKVATEIMRKNN
ncbi:hypothetical protein GCM10027423_45740 [Spirosoma arcticum]